VKKLIAFTKGRQDSGNESADRKKRPPSGESLSLHGSSAVSKNRDSTITTDFHPPDPVIPPDTIIGVLDGAGVRIGMGGQSAGARAVRAATVSGISPEPF